MATLISVHNSEGLVGRCDARCHDAKDPGCDCICGGRNHGVGLAQATENTVEMFDELAAKARADGTYYLRRGKDLGQLSLLEEADDAE